MLRTFIQVTALSLTLIASIFLARGSLSLSVERIVQLSQTYWSYNKQFVENMSQQHADTKIGIIILLSAFFLQMGNFLWPMRINDFKISILGVYIALGVAFIIFGLSLQVSKFISIKIQEKVTSRLSPETK